MWQFPFADALIVAYSGGKDSLACMELVSRAGKRIEPYIMSFLPGLDYTAHWVDFAWKRWRVKVREYPHPGTIEYLRSGTMARQAYDIPVLKHTDVEMVVRQETGLRWLVYGYKRSDSIERNAMMASWPNGVDHRRKIVAPIHRWTQRQVRAYLTVVGIPYEEPYEKRKSNGVGLAPDDMRWIKSDWPGDYRRILKVFPNAAAQIDRASAT